MIGRTRNRLLGAISPTDAALLAPDLEPVELFPRDVVEAPNTPITHAYFPDLGIISVVATSRRDRSLEVGIVGGEGMTGLSLVMGDDRSTNTSYAQSSGAGHRISAACLSLALERSPTLRRCLLHYVQAFLCQTSQTALTNGRANIEERIARWILMAHDRLPGDELELTHEFLATMLGVRRPGVTVALHFLEGRGLIRSTRRRVTVLDRGGLEVTADGSYGVAEAEYERLLGDFRAL